MAKSPRLEVANSGTFARDLILDYRVYCKEDHEFTAKALEQLYD